MWTSAPRTLGSAVRGAPTPGAASDVTARGGTGLMMITSKLDRSVNIELEKYSVVERTAAP